MKDSDNVMSMGGKSLIVLVCLWCEVKESPEVELVALLSLKSVEIIKLGDEMIARCVLSASLEDHHHLLIGLGDGFLLTYNVSVESLADAVANAERSVTVKSYGLSTEEDVIPGRRKLSIGTKDTFLRILKSMGSKHIFAACDRPTVIYSATASGKLLVSNVNFEEVTRFCGFDTEAFPDCLAIATENGLHLGAVNEIQNLHIMSMSLHEHPRRTAHLDEKRFLQF